MKQNVSWNAAAALTLFVLVGRLVVAQSQPVERAPSVGSGLDKRLLEGLPMRSKIEVPDVKSDRGTKSESPRHKVPKGSEGPLPGETQQPLLKIANAMRGVEVRIVQKDTSRATQEAQAQIVKDLAALLEQVRPQQPGGGKQSGTGRGSEQVGAGSGNPAMGPPRDSTSRIERGTKTQGEAADVKELLRRIWGHLPEKLRDQMQASLSEEFLPKYEQLIEDYYRRLAEEGRGTP